MCLVLALYIHKQATNKHQQSNNITFRTFAFIVIHNRIYCYKGIKHCHFNHCEHIIHIFHNVTLVVAIDLSFHPSFMLLFKIYCFK